MKDYEKKRLKEITMELASLSSIVAVTYIAMSYELGNDGKTSNTTKEQYDYAIKTMMPLTKEMNNIIYRNRLP